MRNVSTFGIVMALGLLTAVPVLAQSASTTTGPATQSTTKQKTDGDYSTTGGTTSPAGKAQKQKTDGDYSTTGGTTSPAGNAQKQKTDGDYSTTGGFAGGAQKHE